MARRSDKRPGRPRIASGDAVLRAALQAFAANGFESTSVRTLNRALGLSHNAIYSRYGTKADLWRAAVDWGMDRLNQRLFKAVDDLPADTDPEVALRAALRTFLEASADQPEVLQLLNHEGARPGPRLDYLMERHVLRGAAHISPHYQRLLAAGRARMLSARLLIFLLGHGAAAPFTLTAMSAAFDPLSGPFDADEHIDQAVDALLRAILIPPEVTP